MSAEQFATRARVALCAKWPELGRYHQGELLGILEETYRASEQIAEQQGVAIAKNREATTIPPTLLQVRAYFHELQSTVDPIDFWEHYGAKGWMIGRSKMKNWHLAAQRAARTWTVKEPAHADRAPISEWERRSKMDRIAALKIELKELTNPGGTPWGIALEGSKAERANQLAANIKEIQNELS